MVPRVPRVWFGWVPIVLALSVGVSANDWPHWRGPAASGVAAPSPLPSTWNATTNVAWQTPLQGAGVSSPIVSGNYVFVTSQVGDGRRQGGNHPTLAQGVDPKTAGESTLSRRVPDCRLRKYDIVIGIIGKTQGVKIEASPKPKATRMKPPSPWPCAAAPEGAVDAVGGLASV